MTTEFSLGGVDLRQVGWNIRTVDGWDSFPRKRSGNNFLSHRHGQFVTPRKFYANREIALVMNVGPAPLAGGTPSKTGLEYIQDHIDALLGLCHSNSLLTLARTMPDTTVRTIEVEVIDGFTVQGVAGIARQFVLLLNAPWPFWSGASFSEGPWSGTTTIYLTGNAPCADFTITFSGAGRLTHNGSGAYIDIGLAGTTVVDLKERTAKQGSVHVDSQLDFNEPWWMELDNSVAGNNLTSTVSVTVAGKEAWF